MPNRGTTDGTSCGQRPGIRVLVRRRFRGWATALGLGLGLGCLAGCEAITHASRSLQPAGFDEALTTFDALSQRHDEDREPSELVYSDVIPQRPGLYRFLDAIGIGAVLRLAQITADPRPTRIETQRSTPASCWRRWCGLPSVTRRALRLRPIACSLCLIAILPPFNRMQAIRATGDLLERFDIVPVLGPTPPTSAAARTRVTDLVAALQAGWPGDREGPLPVDQRADYQRALAELTSEPVPEAREQRALLVALSRAYLLESDPELIDSTQQAFAAAFGRALRADGEAIESDNASVRLAGNAGVLALERTNWTKRTFGCDCAAGQRCVGRSASL